jgi:hypothetical protein
MSPTPSLARWTGLLYLGLAVSGLLGYLAIRQQLYVADDATATFRHLMERPGLARAGIAADLSIVLTQALAAVWFARLFRSAAPVAGAMIAAFGLVNAVVILVATAGTATALAVANDASLAPGGDQAATVQLLYVVSGSLWEVGAIFFGLWLVPMGWAVLSSRLMPAALGRVLVAGGVGYVLSAYVRLTVPEAPALTADLLTTVASIGEFWMIGYLLVVGVRRQVSPPGAASPRRGTPARATARG